MEMKEEAAASPTQPAADADPRPTLIAPYMWVGDLVRCHSAVRLLNARFPQRPIDMLTTARTLPLIDYMPGVRKGILSDLPRGRLALAKQWALAQRLKREGYGAALVMPRTWKSALAPFPPESRQARASPAEGAYFRSTTFAGGAGA